MKLRASTYSGGRLPSAKGFTLTEMIVAMAVLVLVVGGIMTAHIFGLVMFQVDQTRLNATGWSRTTFSKIADQVRSGNSVAVGNVDTSNPSNPQFVGLLPGEPMQGNALMVNSTTNSNSFLLYFLNPADQTFRQTDQSGNSFILAHSVTNSPIFAGEDFSGNVLSNTTSSNSPIIHLTLNFYQPAQYLQDAYQYKLETSMTQRILP